MVMVKLESDLQLAFLTPDFSRVLPRFERKKKCKMRLFVTFVVDIVIIWQLKLSKVSFQIAFIA